jgi:Protein of unknown function (DUF1573)
LFSVPAWADSWADALFEERVKDFGSVPRGPTLEHFFRLNNTTSGLVHIASLRVSCGCTSAVALQSSIEPGQSGVIDARMDTRRFSGNKSVTIYVQLDQPAWEEVRLVVRADGRDDLIVSPEAFVLGNTIKGETRTASATVTMYGSDQCQITDIERETSYIETSVQELQRQNGTVSYQVNAAVRADTPPGRWFTDVWVKTNNPSMPRIRIPLTVTVEPVLSVNTPTVSLGDVKAGGEVARKVIIRGGKPFRITELKGTDEQLRVRDNTSEKKSVHVLTITARPEAPGSLTRKVKIVTDLKDGGEIEFEARANVVE